MNGEAGVRSGLRGKRLRRRGISRAGKYTNYRPSLLRRFFTVWLRIAFKLTMRLKIVDLHNLPARGGCIVMINHIAFLDPVIVSGAFPRPVISMAKIEAYDDKVLGPLIRTFDAFPVNRGDVDRSALRMAFDVLDSGLPLLIAPEGTRSQTASLGEAHQGLAYIASQTGAPIVPVAISGSDQWKHNIKHLRRTPIHVRLGQPFMLDAGGEPLDSSILKVMTDEAMVQLAAALPPEQRGIYADLDAATTRYVRFVDPNG
ncbi:MAG TPA: lysophospholipid acyltransferase family protein [Anaerolineae bacterium]|nr:lysophospholipid acyltransferase family protein [Anaerolineae bacterium]